MAIGFSAPLLNVHWTSAWGKWEIDIAGATLRDAGAPRRYRPLQLIAARDDLDARSISRMPRRIARLRGRIVVRPSMTSGTALFERLMADPFAGRIFSKAAKLAGLGVVNKEELAALVVFLVSPAAAKITGQAISMTGGISAL